MAIWGSLAAMATSPSITLIALSFEVGAGSAHLLYLLCTRSQAHNTHTERQYCAV